MWGPFWYIFLLMGNFFYHVWFFFSMWGPLATFSSLLGPFFYHVGRQSYHVGDFFVTFFFLLGTCFTMWWHFCYFFLHLGCFFVHMGSVFVHIRGAFLYIWGAFWAPPPPPVRIFLRAPVCPLPSHTI